MNAITPLPGMPRRCARIVANARLEAEAEARKKACQRAKAMMDDPRGYTDAQMQTACSWFMNQSKSDRDDDGNVYYQRADELLYSITLRQRAAVNRKTFQPETNWQIVKSFKSRWPELGFWACVWAAAMLIGTGWMP